MGVMVVALFQPSGDQSGDGGRLGQRHNANVVVLQGHSGGPPIPSLCSLLTG